MHIESLRPPDGKLGFLTLLSFVLVSGGCSSVSEDEVARKVSPSGQLVAILTEVDAGATAGFGYKVYIEAPNLGSSRKLVAHVYDARRNDQAYGLDLKWLSSDRLSIEFYKARWIDFLLFHAETQGQKVSIEVLYNRTNNSAPSGGMLYNLEKLKEGAGSK